MIEISVSEVTRDAPAVSPETATVAAAQELRKTDVPALVVRDATEGVIGIVRESDVVAVVAEQGGNMRLESYMSAPVVSISPTASVNTAAETMREAGVTCLPVIDDGIYLGVVTPADLAPYVTRKRLDIEYDSDPLSLDSPAATGVPGD